MKTAELFKQKTVLSLEIFPPKPTSDDRVIYDTLDGLKEVKPDFISVTFHTAGGNAGDKTIKIASDVKRLYGIESVAHLPCANMKKDEIVSVLERLKAEGIDNVLALRGDIRGDIRGDFNHANQLIEFIKSRYDFNIIAACYPEGHKESANVIEDVRNLKLKTDCGADQLITQLFLDNEYFYVFRERCALAGIDKPIEAGIMPVTNKKQIERMVELCGIALPKKFMRVIERYGHNAEALRDAGIAYAIDQIVDLISEGVDGVHLYTMNNAYVARKIYEAVFRLL